MGFFGFPVPDDCPHVKTGSTADTSTCSSCSSVQNQDSLRHVHTEDTLLQDLDTPPQDCREDALIFDHTDASLHHSLNDSQTGGATDQSLVSVPKVKDSSENGFNQDNQQRINGDFQTVIKRNELKVFFNVSTVDSRLVSSITNMTYCLFSVIIYITSYPTLYTDLPRLLQLLQFYEDSYSSRVLTENPDRNSPGHQARNRQRGPRQLKDVEEALHRVQGRHHGKERREEREESHLQDVEDVFDHLCGQHQVLCAILHHIQSCLTHIISGAFVW
ncbi:hypothetical protein ACOMHN_011570 [Nucella lapillus]